MSLKKAYRVMPSPIPVGDTGKMTRVTPIINGDPRMPVRDIIMAVCDMSNIRATEAWTRLSESNKEELREYCDRFQFPGKGQREMTCINLEEAIKLLLSCAYVTLISSTTTPFPTALRAQLGRAHIVLFGIPISWKGLASDAVHQSGGGQQAHHVPPSQRDSEMLPHQAR